MNKIISRSLSLMILVNMFCITANAASSPQMAVLDWHSASDYSDWINVKTMGAVGDGVHDDTEAIQSALDRLSGNSTFGGFNTVYFPPGTYNISSTLNLSDKMGISLIGSGSATILAWVGPADGVMYNSDGVTRSRYVGITWDGKNIAAVGVDHRSQKRYETRVRHEQEMFKNFTDTGVRVGYLQKVATAEMFFLNDIFQDNGIGVAFLSYNNYDNKFLKTEFLNNGTGIKNDKGNFDVSETNFYHNKTADVTSIVHSLRLRSVTSEGSGQFLVMGLTGATGELNVQDCRVSDWTNLDHGAINLSPRNTAIIFDCAFSNSDPAAKSPIQLTNGPWIAQLLTVSNNTWESAAGVPLVSTFMSNCKVVKIPGSFPLAKLNTSFVSSSYTTPAHVFDFRRYGAKETNGDITAAVQSTIDAAMAAGDGAVAYFPSGYYKILRQIKIIKGKNLTILGSGFNTAFIWGGGNDPGLSMFYVLDPVNVKIEQLKVLTSISPASADTSDDGVCRIKQAVSRPDVVSSTVYDGVYLGGSYLGQYKSLDQMPDRNVCGLMLAGLSAGSTVHAIHFDGPIHAADSSQAKIFVDTSYDGVIDVSGADEPRTGYFDIVSRDAGGNYYDQIVEDDQNLTIGYDYSESSFCQLHLLGSSADRSTGHVTILPAKEQSGAPYQVKIDGYSGRLSVLSASYINGPMYSNTAPTISVSQSDSSSPLSILFWGNTFWSEPQFHLNTGSSLMLLQNQLVDVKNAGDHTLLLPDTASGPAIAQAQAALDDLRDLAKNALSQTDY